VRRASVGLVVVHLLACATLLAQGQTDRPQFRTGVELIQLDVSVLDEQRLPVRGLTAADFTVLDNGRPTQIRAFAPVELAQRVRANEAMWANEVPPDVVTNQIGEQDGRLVVILMDRSIPANEPGIVARRIAAAAVDALGPNDLGAVVSTHNNAVQDGRVQNFTADHQRLLRAINYADPATGISPEAEIIMGKLDPRNDGRCLCGLCVFETLTRVADAVQNMPRRRKVLFFIGSNVLWQSSRPVAEAGQDPGCESRLKDACAVMFAAVDRANLTIHSIDPQGLVNLGPQTMAGARGGFDRAVNSGPAERLRQQQTTTNDSITARQNLDVLPARTGGRTVVGRNDPEQTVPGIFRESDAYYVLGIERGPSNGSDETHSLAIKVARKGVRADMQWRYVSRPSTNASATPSVEDALTQLLPNAAVPLSFALTTFASPNGNKAMVRVSIDAAAFAPTGGTAVPLEITVHAMDRVGRSIASARQTSTLAVTRAAARPAEVNVQSHLELPPGEYEVRAAVSDPATGKVASVFSFLTIPKFEDDALSLSDVSVETPSGTSGESTPTMRRTFPRSEQVRAVLQIYQGTQKVDPIRPVSVRVQILDAKGAAIRDQSLPFAEQAFTNRRADCVITLPLANLPPGDYLLKLEASTDQRRAGRAVRFAIEQ
jgi:VWFA-related protein